MNDVDQTQLQVRKEADRAAREAADVGIEALRSRAHDATGDLDDAASRAERITSANDRLVAAQERHADALLEQGRHHLHGDSPVERLQGIAEMAAGTLSSAAATAEHGVNSLVQSAAHAAHRVVNEADRRIDQVADAAADQVNAPGDDRAHISTAPGAEPKPVIPPTDHTPPPEPKPNEPAIRPPHEPPGPAPDKPLHHPADKMPTQPDKPGSEGQVAVPPVVPPVEPPVREPVAHPDREPVAHPDREHQPQVRHQPVPEEHAVHHSGFHYKPDGDLVFSTTDLTTREQVTVDSHGGKHVTTTESQVNTDEVFHRDGTRDVFISARDEFGTADGGPDRDAVVQSHTVEGHTWEHHDGHGGITAGARSETTDRQQSYDGSGRVVSSSERSEQASDQAGPTHVWGTASTASSDFGAASDGIQGHAPAAQVHQDAPEDLLH